MRAANESQDSADLYSGGGCAAMLTDVREGGWGTNGVVAWVTWRRSVVG